MDPDSDIVPDPVLDLVLGLVPDPVLDLVLDLCLDLVPDLFADPVPDLGPDLVLDPVVDLFDSATWYSTHTCGSTVKMVLLYKIFTLNKANHVWRSRTPDGVQCVHFPSVITTIMIHKLLLLKMLNKRELYAT
jgi:hypothetical protein